MAATLLDMIRDQARSRSAILGRKRMVEGDHWLDGDGWVGPRPPADRAGRVLETIRSQFVWKNVVAEICRRHRDGVVGKEPIFSMVVRRPLENLEEPSAEEQALIKEAEAALTLWWDRQKAHLALQEAVMTLLWAKLGNAPAGVAPLRLYLPGRLLERGPTGERFVPRVDLQEATRYIYAHAVSPLVGGVVYDMDGDPLAGYYNYEEDKQQYQEITALARTLEEHGLVEPGVYDPEDTVVQVRNAQGEVVDQAGYSIGGRLMMVELHRDEALLSDSIISQQKLLNMAMTMLGRNVVLGGFLERTILNAQLPGHFVDEDTGNPSPTGTKFEPDPVVVGAGSLNYLTGHPIRDEMGNVTGYATPNIIYRDPVPVQTFADTIRETRVSIYEEAQQLHVMISGDATTSGQSRVQATNDFVSSLGVTALAVQTGMREMLETALALASFFSGTVERYEELRAEASVNLSAVQPSPEEIKVNLLQYNGGTLSRETTMARNGVEDVAAEQQRIVAELEEFVPTTTPPGTLQEEDEQDQETSQEQPVELAS